MKSYVNNKYPKAFAIYKLSTIRFANYKPSTIALYNQKREVLLKEISLVAVSFQTGDILAVGNEAREKQSILENEGAIIGSPLKNGLVAEFGISGVLFWHFFKKVQVRRFPRPEIAVCVPVEMTQVEKHVLNELMRYLGIKNTLIVEQSYEKAAQSIMDKYKIIIEIMPELEF